MRPSKLVECLDDSLGSSAVLSVPSHRRLKALAAKRLQNNSPRRKPWVEQVSVQPRKGERPPLPRFLHSCTTQKQLQIPPSTGSGQALSAASLFRFAKQRFARDDNSYFGSIGCAKWAKRDWKTSSSRPFHWFQSWPPGPGWNSLEMWRVLNRAANWRFADVPPRNPSPSRRRLPRRPSLVQKIELHVSMIKQGRLAN